MKINTKKENSIFLLILGVSLLLSIACKKKTTLNVPIVESNMRFLENDRIKFGIDLRIGGAATYLTDQLNGGENMINSTDWGRQIQMSYYSGPIPYIGPNGEVPFPGWAGLGWNPIQAGNYGAMGSKVISFEKRGDNAMIVRTIPMHWPFETYVPGECIFECLYTLDKNIITMEATLINNRPDKTLYNGRHQEMPAVYTNGSWYKLITYFGDEPFTGKPLTTIVDQADTKGWPWVHFYTPENWVALMDNNGFGLGVFQPDAMMVNAGFTGGDSRKGSGNDKDPQAGYIAPRGIQILDHNITWTYKTSLVLGTIDDIRNFAKDNWKGNKPAWVFDNSRDDWYYEGTLSDTGWPIQGALDIKFNANAALVGPITFWKAAEFPYLEIEGEFKTANNQLNLSAVIQPVEKSDFTDWLNWSEGVQDADREKLEKAAEFPAKPAFIVTQNIVADGVHRTYRIYLGDKSQYTGAMKNLKVRFGINGQAKISKIRFVQ